MLKFLARIFGTQSSGQTARERLKLVLLSDHLSLAPDVVEALKSDLLAVIGKYVEIDTAHVVVDFEHREHDIALTANVPILAMRERPLAAVQPAPPNVLALVPPAEPAADGAVAAQVAEPQAVPVGDAGPSDTAAVASERAPVALPGVEVAARPVSAPKPRSRRRRRKGGAAPVGTASLGKAAKA